MDFEFHSTRGARVPKKKVGGTWTGEEGTWTGEEDMNSSQSELSFSSFLEGFSFRVSTCGPRTPGQQGPRRAGRGPNGSNVQHTQWSR